MGYSQDKHKIKKLYEQNIAQSKELEQLSVPNIKEKHNNLLRKAKILNSEVAQVIPNVSSTIGRPTNGLPISSWASPIGISPPIYAWGNIMGFRYDVDYRAAYIHIQVFGVLDKIYSVNHQSQPGIIALDSSPFYSGDRELFTPGSTYSWRARTVINNRFGEWSDIFQFSLYPIFPVPPLPTPLYALTYVPGGTGGSNLLLEATKSGTTIVDFSIPELSSPRPYQPSPYSDYYTSFIVAESGSRVSYSYNAGSGLWTLNRTQFQRGAYAFRATLNIPYKIIENWQEGGWNPDTLIAREEVYGTASLRLDGRNGITGTLTMTDAVSTLAPPTPPDYQIIYSIPGNVTVEIVSPTSDVDLTGIDRSKNIIFNYISGDIIELRYATTNFNPGYAYINENNPTFVLPHNAIDLVLLWFYYTNSLFNIPGSHSFSVPITQCGLQLTQQYPSENFRAYSD